MPEPVTPWEEAFRVRTYEVDPAGCASIQTLCNYLQEAAGNHARQLGVSMEQMEGQNLTWVLARLHVEVNRYPRWKDTVEVETWPSGFEGLYARREFIVENGSPEPLLKATSAWLLVDIRRRRPVRIPEFVTAIVSPRQQRALDDTFSDLPGLNQAEHERRFHVRYSDLDLNQHVNNVRYIEWAVETLPLEIIRNRHLARIEVAFRAETNYGDVVTGQAQQLNDSPLTFAHRVLREADGRETALVRTVWRDE
jgi:medium-chain acyl-[acyl-carrier-protein] hydrolase